MEGTDYWRVFHVISDKIGGKWNASEKKVRVYEAFFNKIELILATFKVKKTYERLQYPFSFDSFFIIMNIFGAFKI